MCTATEWYCWPGATHRNRTDCHILSVAAVVLPWPNQCDSWAFPVMALSIANIPSCVVYKWSCTLHATDCNSFISASYSFTQSINRDIMTADWKRRSVYHEWTTSWHDTLWTLWQSEHAKATCEIMTLSMDRSGKETTKCNQKGNLSTVFVW